MKKKKKKKKPKILLNEYEILTYSKALKQSISNFMQSTYKSIITNCSMISIYEMKMRCNHNAILVHFNRTHIKAPSLQNVFRESIEA